jgi:hypothetical protein
VRVFAALKVDLHGLCSCIHQLLHLQPLACSVETVEVLSRRGLNVAHCAALVRSTRIGGEARAKAAVCGRTQYLVPQASLKRYCCFILWYLSQLVMCVL